MPLARSTVPSVGSALTVTVNCEEEKLTSLGALIPIAVATLFSATVKEAGVVTNEALLAPILSVALPVAVAPVGSVTLYLKLEVWAEAPAVGTNSRPTSWVAVKL